MTDRLEPMDPFELALRRRMLAAGDRVLRPFDPLAITDAAAGPARVGLRRRSSPGDDAPLAAGRRGRDGGRGHALRPRDRREAAAAGHADTRPVGARRCQSPSRPRASARPSRRPRTIVRLRRLRRDRPVEAPIQPATSAGQLDGRLDVPHAGLRHAVHASCRPRTRSPTVAAIRGPQRHDHRVVGQLRRRLRCSRDRPARLTAPGPRAGCGPMSVSGGATQASSGPSPRHRRSPG